MLNLIIKRIGYNDYYGVVTSYGSDNDKGTILNNKNEIKTCPKSEMEPLDKVEQLRIFNKYFAKYMNLPGHLCELNDSI